MTTSPRLKERIYKQTRSLISSMEKNKLSIPMNFKNFDEFKAYCEKFFDNEEFSQTIDDKDIKFLYQQDKIQSIVDSEAEADELKDIQRRLLRDNPELSRVPTELLHLAQREYRNARKQEKAVLRRQVRAEIDGDTTGLKMPLKKQLKYEATIEARRIQQMTKKGGHSYTRTAPKKFPLTKWKERFFRNNKDISPREFINLYRATYPEDQRTDGSIYYKRYRFIKKLSK